MNLDEIKNILTSSSDKFVFIENGQPLFVMMTYAEYRKNFGAQKLSKNESDIIGKQEEKVFTPELLSSRANQTTNDLPKDHLTLEDLPF